MANHATRVQRYVDRYGGQAVEHSSTAAYPWRTCRSPRPFHQKARRRRKSRWGLPEIPGSDHEHDPFHCGPKSSFSCSHRLYPGRRDGFRLTAPEGARRKTFLPMTRRRTGRSSPAQEQGIHGPLRQSPRISPVPAEELKAKRKERKKFPESAEPISFILDRECPLKNWQRTYSPSSGKRPITSFPRSDQNHE